MGCFSAKMASCLLNNLEHLGCALTPAVFILFVFFFHPNRRNNSTCWLMRLYDDIRVTRRLRLDLVDNSMFKKLRMLGLHFLCF